ncbi:hypothetical protein [Solemya pervernicosa gill symbiont]|nr:hypothetical protein [Solemya pervernicosa gill symbiont]
MKLLLPLLALMMTAPAHALSIVSLHGGMVAPMATAPVDTAVIVTSLSLLAGVMIFRMMRRNKIK